MSLNTFLALRKGGPSLSDFLGALEPAGWLYSITPTFIVTIHQPPGSFMRYALLPLNIISPVMGYWTAPKAAAVLPGTDWMIAFLAIIFGVHMTAGLYLEGWHLPLAKDGKTAPSTSAWDIRNSFRYGHNPRRLPLDGPERANSSERALFCLRQIFRALLLAMANSAIDVGLTYLLFPFPRDFNPDKATYLHFTWDRQTKLRAVYCLQWLWQSNLTLNAVHAIVSTFWVGIVGIDEPHDWPPLFGSIFDAYSLQRFWGRYWHRIGSPAQRVWGQALARCLSLRKGEAAEKTFVALFVFLVSGLTHYAVMWRVGAAQEPRAELLFMLLNFAGGLVEFIAKRVFFKERNAKATPVAWKVLGYVWVYVFFYIVVPPCEWPILRAEVAKRVPDVKLKINIPPKV